jgi:hypothetical protein
MQPLSHEQEQLLFDYSLDLTTEEETAQAEALVGSSREAADVHSKIKSVLAPLDILDEPCPEELAERTIWRLKQLANDEPSASEPIAVASKPWRNFAQVGAIAASVVLVIGVLVPSFSFANHLHRKRVCQSQLAGIGSSMTSYCSDYDGNLPVVSTDVTQPWHRVGDQGEESRSNTRNLYLLLKLGYCTNPSDFVCCGRKQGQFSLLKVSDVESYNDFPRTEQITYSYRIPCQRTTKITMFQGPIMADRNPVFDSLQAGEFQVRLDERLSTTASRNHSRHGQMVLFAGGQVRFLKTRHVGVPKDDIFTVQNVVEYRGNERPACEKDPFLAP